MRQLTSAEPFQSSLLGHLLPLSSPSKHPAPVEAVSTWDLPKLEHCPQASSLPRETTRRGFICRAWVVSLPQGRVAQTSPVKGHGFSGSVLPVSAAGISTGLPAGASIKRKKAFAGDSPYDAEESLIGTPEMTLYIPCSEGFLQSLMKETHKHYSKHESELAWHCPSSPLPFKGLATTTLFVTASSRRPPVMGRSLQSLHSCLRHSPFRRCHPAPAHRPPVTVSVCMELQ